MKLALQVLLGIPASDSTNDKAVRSLAAEVNNQWIRSKGPYEADPEWRFKEQTDLLKVITAIFPDFDVDNSFDNPMSLILPGYETLWRVVLRCFLELTARSHANREQWQRLLQAFATDPTVAQLDKNDDSSGLSAAVVAQEGMSLHRKASAVY